jgi:hypothetical protein
MPNNIIILATFWNEKYWIQDSLNQINKIAPKKVIICDGCFDHKFPLNSIDGTYEVLQQFCEKNDYAKLVSPIRIKKGVNLKFVKNIWNYGFNKQISLSSPIILKRILRANYYRVNQALTISMMLKKSGIKENEWFMTFDADQFYNEDFFEYIKKIDSLDEDIMLFKAREYRFIDGFSTYVKKKESFAGNNLPYRYKKNTIILPTRSVYLQGKLKPLIYKKFKAMVIGHYFHYKTNYPERSKIAYIVGDRKLPSYKGLRIQTFNGLHPIIIMDKLIRERIELGEDNVIYKPKTQARP